MESLSDFEAFVAEHGDGLVRFAFLLCHDRGRAEDLAQEVLLRMYRRWSVAAPPVDRLAYVRRALTREYLGWRRRLSSREVVGIDQRSAPWQPSGDTQVVDREELWRLMAQLQARQRAVLVLRYYEDLDDTQTAQILGCARATIRSLAARALTRLRQRMDVQPVTSVEGVGEHG